MNMNIKLKVRKRGTKEVAVERGLPGAGVLGWVSAGVPVVGVLPGDSGWAAAAAAAAFLLSSSSIIQGMDHSPFTSSNSWTYKVHIHSRVKTRSNKGVIMVKHTQYCSRQLTLKRVVRHTFLRINDITPIRVRTCCRDNPSRGTPSAKVSAPSAPGSHKCLMKSDTYALGERNRSLKWMTKTCRSVYTALRYATAKQWKDGTVTYLNSFSDFPRRSLTNHWVVKASWGGIP